MEFTKNYAQLAALSRLNSFAVYWVNRQETPEGSPEEGEEPSAKENEGSKEETGGIQMQELVMEIDGTRFPVILYDNETTQAFMDRLPMTLDMEELHGNEKLNYLDQGLPTNPI